MLIHVFPSGPLATNAYVVACSKTRHAAIIDPGLESAVEIKDYLQRHHLVPQMILLTHTHWDHIGNVADLKKELKLPVFVHRDDAANLRNPGVDKLPLWVGIEGVEPDGFLEDGQIIPLGNLQFQVIHTPGHSPGGVCFYEPNQRVLISGDTLFKGTMGNLSFTTGQPEKMWQSLRKLSQLPSKTRVYPGHGDKTMIGNEGWMSQAEKIFGNG